MPFTKRVSRLVYETYNGETSNFITHKDGNFRNNALDNLVAITPSELGIR
ncbi:HNH endonuclease, partial [Mycobacterium kansasii]